VTFCNKFLKTEWLALGEPLAPGGSRLTGEECGIVNELVAQLCCDRDILVLKGNILNRYGLQ
jgi:hypothetical protein